MATKKSKAEEQIKQAQQQEQPYVKWEDKTNAEREASINSYHASIIVKTSQQAREQNKPEMAFWNKNMSKEEIANSMPYNAKTGQPYTNVSDVILRCVTQLNGYKEPTFLTMNEANLLGGKLKKQLDQDGNEVLTKNGKTAYVLGVKIPYVQEGQWQNKVDENNQVIKTQAKDKEGNFKFDEKGQPVMREVKEYVPFKAPMLETINLYHISQFTDLDTSKLKPRDLSKVEKRAEYFRQNPEKLAKPERITNFGLNANLAQNLSNFVKAVKSGNDYQRTQTQTLNREAKKELSFTR
ncbi:ArdC-like ssDNA-binding domain-containing protein [Campylobacter sp. MIT 97-5078]|uniref:ArdC-like ssDNA-binding domain-containing protein n=1 Tax=Campylobacter sp. MIT 97-5078 TaxID=1548153 RepID=UPI000512E50B|nr:ArdC-like ssDNA-binding domain-containing protein [Campylobacter sp. MIT 97-5078]KGI55668.1 hypothetical protein LR59_10975 [Campylobacter sp. MIT 97-5078]KGI56810.1 hypothetical protein LR59_04830 [Campylobacter sp. MIT 97-5078]TQR25587.1 DUF1738 domain-containing protein [Campylobacter sp. MIT 97-5078]